MLDASHRNFPGGKSPSNPRAKASRNSSLIPCRHAGGGFLRALLLIMRQVAKAAARPFKHEKKGHKTVSEKTIEVQIGAHEDGECFVVSRLVPLIFDNGRFFNWEFHEHFPDSELFEDILPDAVEPGELYEATITLKKKAVERLPE